MGACASCLGRREDDGYDETEESRLLYDDGSGMLYGSFGDGAMGGDETLEALREAEALQRVVARTSSNMVDVFESAPLTRSGTSHPFGYGGGQGARAARYQHLVSKLGADEECDLADVRVDWMVDDDGGGAHVMGNGTAIETNGGGPLVGTFADAAAAAVQ
ncbi:late endosomal/lysosomal adaptor and MAPK and MTOR activator domain-containing protein [Ophiocordyceps camponoti-floridani]|uniref:Late endosomal/lysosomal adaptor and MAPK and MTOR activator domain-containing protein n=1 Tax=Ophiocordyceps camponoti-floridani TaxID=2030778 RepID=A0A8H4VH48_9HYPO|nr:late endosomal/lysosomal adaptor and MAPK and MTOR activator domain-containing protein [Ophiocordyceps camponoti-floridani]